MDSSEALRKADEIALAFKIELPSNQNHFGNYAKEVAHAVSQAGTTWKRNRSRWLKEWSIKWREMYDTFEEERLRDPMIAYRPQHGVSQAFHSSPAFIRYFRAGNRTSKTQSGYAEHYFTLTGQYPFRKALPGNSFIVGLAFSKYAPNVFEKKFITGEEDNPLSPMFPDGGKWFHHYDERKHIITVACKNCAEAGKPKQCPHQKWTVTLYSDEGSWEVLQGAQFRLGHFDEHVRKDFFAESAQRLAATAAGGSSLIVTGTPLFGFGAWENDLAALALGDPKKNLRDPENPKSPPYISLHEISQFDAGIVPHDVIRMNMQSLSEFEIEARIYGRPAPLSENPVFDLKQLSEYRRLCKEPTYTVLHAEKPLEEVTQHDDIIVDKLGNRAIDGWTGLRVWEYPTQHGQYITAVDSAKGLINGDASCCSVLKLESKVQKLALRLVAQYHGWLNTFDYGDEVFKLSVLYNDALCVVETTGGFGEAVLLRLKQLGYWNIFRDSSQERVMAGPEPRFGVETNQQTKPFMVAALQQFVRDNLIEIPCVDTISEMVAFEQKRTTKTGELLVAPKFQGSGGAHDDRVMSLVIAAGVAVSYPIFDYTTDLSRVELERKHQTSEFWQEIHKEIKDRETPEPENYMGMEW